MKLYILSIFGLLFAACGEIIEPDGQTEQQEVAVYGTITFEFPLVDNYGAGICTRRMDLSLAWSADSLYRKEFVTAANLSDYAGTYTFTLPPGKYFYQAGKICTCLGDTCLWNGYPGGQYGERWTMGWFEVSEGSKVVEGISFKK